MGKKGKQRTIREKLIQALMLYGSDELCEIGDWIDISKESEEELIDRLINILNYYYYEYNS